MKSLAIVPIAVAAMMPTAALAQSVTLEQLAQRIDALEREVQTLRRENDALRAQPSAAPVAAPVAAPALAPAPAQPAASPHAAGPGFPLDRWEGPYMGLSAGHGTTNYRLTGFYPPINQRDVSSDMAGVQMGYRWQRGPFVGGLEVSTRLYDEDDSVTNNLTDYRFDRAAQVRGQAGLAYDRWLAYGILGFEVRRATKKAISDGIYEQRKFQETSPVQGFGLGYMFDTGSSIELEYTTFKTWRTGTEPQSSDNEDETWTVRLNQLF